MSTLRTLASEINSLASACLPLRRPLGGPALGFAALYGWDARDLDHQRLLAAIALLDSALKGSSPCDASLFFPTPLDYLGLSAPDGLARSIAEAAREAAKDSNFIGELYAEIVPQSKRRRAGQFWTGQRIAEWMIAWLLEGGPRKLLDVGCGAGNFLLEAARLSGDGEKRTALYGLDLNPVLLNATRSAFLARYGESPHLLPQLVAQDFLSESLPIEPDAIVCNPPYTRHHHIASDVKERMRRFVKARLGMEVSRQATLACYFLLKLIADMRDGARAAVIVPMETLDARYGIASKRALRDRTRILALIRFAPRMNAFNRVDVGACILLFEKGYRPANMLRHLTLEDMPSTQELLDCLKQGPARVSFGSMEVEAQDELKEDDKWLAGGPPGLRKRVFPDNRAVVPLKSLARVVRGIATGANDFFVLSTEIVERLSLSRFVVPTVHRNREIQDLLLDRKSWQALSDEGRRVWLLYVNGEVEDPHLRSYIAEGEARGYHLRSLVRTRRRWFQMERREVPPIFFTLLTRGNPRFILNRAGVRPINMFLLIYPDRRIVEAGAVELLWALLNSRFTISRLHSVSRTYGGNTLKVEPREMDNLPVLDPLKLPESIGRQLLDRVSDYQRHRDARALLGQVDQVVERFMGCEISLH